MLSPLQGEGFCLLRQSLRSPASANQSHLPRLYCQCNTGAGMTAFNHPLFSSPPPPAEEVPLVPPTDAAAPRSESRWRRRLRWVGRGFAAFALLFILLVGWLAITAPLSKSLEPIAPPALTLLASDGTPNARTGAIVDRKSTSLN